MYTEAEAKTKWCPLARPTVWNGDTTIAAAGNLNQDGDPAAHCLASACMAWRWADGLDLIDSMVAERNGSRRGFCGAFGPAKAGAA